MRCLYFSPISLSPLSFFNSTLRAFNFKISSPFSLSRSLHLLILLQTLLYVIALSLSFSNSLTHSDLTKNYFSLFSIFYSSEILKGKPRGSPSSIFSQKEEEFSRIFLNRTFCPFPDSEIENNFHGNVSIGDLNFEYFNAILFSKSSWLRVFRFAKQFGFCVYSCNGR